MATNSVEINPCNNARQNNNPPPFNSCDVLRLICKHRSVCGCERKKSYVAQSPTCFIFPIASLDQEPIPYDAAKVTVPMSALAVGALRAGSVPCPGLKLTAGTRGPPLRHRPGHRQRVNGDNLRHFVILKSSKGAAVKAKHIVGVPGGVLVAMIGVAQLNIRGSQPEQPTLSCVFGSA